MTDSTLGSSDLRIYEDVLQELRWSANVKHTSIGVLVENGVVTLTGHVEDASGREEAVVAARRVDGVANVIDEMHIVPPPASADEVRDAIEHALARHAAHAARHVEVNVDAGVVRLAGDLPSQRVREAVEGAARGTKGVRSVESRLHVR